MNVLQRSQCSPLQNKEAEREQNRAFKKVKAILVIKHCFYDWFKISPHILRVIQISMSIPPNYERKGKMKPNIWEMYQILRFQTTYS